jgi:heme/flavin dehydrogenase (mycofactocin system)
MANAWFETVAEAQRRAKKYVPRPVYGALMAGSEAGVSFDANLKAFAELGFAPEVANKPAERALATEVMGQPISMPVLISPTGVQAVHPDGELAVARAAANRGIAMGLSSFASKPIEEVVAANPQTFFQIYWCGTKDQMKQRLDRAAAAGAAGLIVTLDWSFSHGRDWGSPYIPERMSMRALLRYTPELVRRPRYVGKWARTFTIPDLTVPNMVVDGRPAPTFFEAYGEWMQTPPATWDDLRWLRAQWNGPLMIKGIIRVDDALRAADIGATAISVSNHGGNNLDSTPAPIRALPAIAEAVGDSIEVVLDGGIRRGSDVVKTVALGARAAMIGRAYLWGLAANGQAGVENVLDVLRGGIDSALLGLSKPAITDLRPSDIVVPDGFTRTLGAPAASAARKAPARKAAPRKAAARKAASPRR